MAFWLPLLAATSAIGAIGGKAAQSSAAGRAREAELLLERDRLAQQDRLMRQQAEVSNAALRERGLMDRATLDLQRRQYADAAPRERYLQAILGNLAANMQDVTANRPRGVPTIRFSGGARPSAIGPGGRAAGAELAQQAMMRLMKGDSFDDLPEAQLASILPALQQSALPKASGWERLGSTMGIIGSLAGSALPFIPNGGGTLPPGTTGSLSPSAGGWTPPDLSGGGQSLASRLLSSNVGGGGNASGGGGLYSNLFGG